VSDVGSSCAVGSYFTRVPPFQLLNYTFPLAANVFSRTSHCSTFLIKACVSQNRELSVVGFVAVQLHMQHKKPEALPQEELKNVLRKLFASNLSTSCSLTVCFLIKVCSSSKIGPERTECCQPIL
jgi:hypothetical protein